jgi:hypothetical protein
MESEKVWHHGNERAFEWMNPEDLEEAAIEI